MSGVAITESELLDALALATPGDGPEDARSAQEMADAMGLYVGRVRRALKALQTAGRLVTHRVRRTDLSGRVVWVPAYTIVPG